MSTESKFFVGIGNHKVHYKELIEHALKTSLGEMPDLFQDDIYFIFPFTNQALTLISGIECTYFKKNLLPAAILARSLIDCTMSLVYVIQVSDDDYQDFLDEFRRSGELTKANLKRKKRMRLTGRDLTKVFLESTGIDLSNSYKQLSKMVHPTVFHMHANTKMIANTEDKVEIAFIGEKLEYPQHLYDELEDIVILCIKTIIQVLKSRCIQCKGGDLHEYL